MSLSKSERVAVAAATLVGGTGVCLTGGLIGGYVAGGLRAQSIENDQMRKQLAARNRAAAPEPQKQEEGKDEQNLPGTQEQVDPLAQNSIPSSIPDVPEQRGTFTNLGEHTPDLTSTGEPAIVQEELPQGAPQTSPEPSTESDVPQNTAPDQTPYPALEAGGTSPKFEVVGVPNTVNIPQNSDLTPNNGADQDGVDHVSKLGQFTGIASPGVYYYDGNRDSAAASDAANGTNIVHDIDSGVCSVQGSDTRINFGAGDNVVAPINEGTFREVETAGGDWTLHMPSGDVQIHLEPQDNHAWMIIVKGLTQDGVTPQDRNISIEHNGRDAFSNSTMTGEGAFMSQDMVDQIARSMHTAEGAANSSGADGSKAVNILYVDANTGSVSVFEVVFDAAGNPTSYKLVSTNTTVTP